MFSQGEGWSVGGSGLAVCAGQQEAVRGGRHEAALAEIRQKLLHQVCQLYARIVSLIK